MIVNLFSILVQTASVSSPPLFELPRQFWGEYNEVLSDCGTGNNDSRLRISWNTIQFYESTGEIEEILRLSDGSIVVVAKHEGEGQTWQSTYQLQLSSDGKVLSVINPQTNEIEQLSTSRYRCPVTRKKTK